MAADILLYDADLVPVGEDQKQHLELARNIAQQRINSRFGSEEKPILKVPEPLIIKEGARVMSLTDGTAKMSKSDPNEGSRINLLDPPELIVKKIKRAKTDPMIGLEFDNPERPEASNLLNIYAIVSGLERQLVVNECASMGWGKFKPLLADALVETLRPVQTNYAEIIANKTELIDTLKQGREKAEEVASGEAPRKSRIRRSQFTGEMLTSEDLIFLCKAFGIQVIESNTFRGDVVENSAYLEAVSNNLSKSPDHLDYKSETEELLGLGVPKQTSKQPPDVASITEELLGLSRPKPMEHNKIRT